MNPFETPSGLCAAFDTLLAGMQRQLRLYDHDLSVFGLDDPARHASLRAACLAGGGHRMELLLDTIDHVARDHPRLMQLVRDFGHVLEIRLADPALPRPDHAFVLADRRSVLLRADKRAVHGSLHRDDPLAATQLNQEFETLWQRSPAGVSATTLGL